MKVADLLSAALGEARSVAPEVAATLLGFAQRATVCEDAETPTLSIAPEGLRMGIATLFQCGMEEVELGLMVKDNPARLLGL